MSVSGIGTAGYPVAGYETRKTERNVTGGSFADMDSDSCHSSVVNVIYNLRKKIEPDSKNPAYIKTLLGVGYKFDM